MQSKKKNSRSYTEEELNIIKTYYPSYGLERTMSELYKANYTRSRLAVQSKVKTLLLKVNESVKQETLVQMKEKMNKFSTRKKFVLSKRKEESLLVPKFIHDKLNKVMR